MTKWSLRLQYFNWQKIFVRKTISQERLPLCFIFSQHCSIFSSHSCVKINVLLAEIKLGIQFCWFLQIVQLFTHILIGNYDGSVMRYFLLICDFIDQVEWKEVEDFRAFAAGIYPFLNVRILITALVTQAQPFCFTTILKHLIYV